MLGRAISQPASRVAPDKSGMAGQCGMAGPPHEYALRLSGEYPLCREECTRRSCELG